MCGIVGVIDWTTGRVNEARVRALTDTLRHRGPDGEGFYVAGNAALGHRRLSIIDLALGKQPMSNEDGTVWISYNGEVYNFQQLRDELEARGHRFQTHCDTEAIVHGYEEWGEDVVTHLRGMFAFGILDTRRQRMFLARDRAGIKPLVYYAGADRFIFASEIKAIIEDPGVPRDLDHDAVADYFECGYVPAPATVFRGISKLPPGHTLTVDLAGPATATPRKYWDLGDFYAQGPIATSEEEAAERIRELLRDAVKVRLVSDVPLGALLSGGIDSSAVATLMASVVDGPISTFSIGFNEEKYSEVNYARKVAETIKSNHFEKTVTAEIRDLLPKLVYHFDEPFADASAIPTYYVSRVAREHVTVCLSGDGGDEGFAGYERYGACLRMGGYDFLPQAVRQAVFTPLSRIVPQASSRSRTFAGVARNADERFIGHMRTMYGHIPPQRLLSASFRGKLRSRGLEPDFLTRSLNRKVEDTLARYLDLDFRTYLPNDILVKVDITSMMNSLEVRVPFLDPALLQYAARIDSGLKQRDGKGKYILKKALKGVLSDEVLQRKKMGFGVPIRAWLGGQLRETTHEYLLNPSRGSGVLEPSTIAQLVKDNEARPYHNPAGGRLWWCLFFEMWYRDVFSGRQRRQVA
jgi:asparagine synthase (glutamine-hydrolysing)